VSAITQNTLSAHGERFLIFSERNRNERRA
jgi:hypothetical protein